MNARTKALAVLLLIATTIGCDRVTKRVASVTLAGTPGRSLFADVVRFEYAENTGGFLSLGADWPPGLRTGLFTVGTGVLLLAVTVVAVRLRWTGWALGAVSLVVAGGASNWIDRVDHGSVVDFMIVGVGPLRTGIFNVADMAVMAGVGILFLMQVRKTRA